jgi:predicted transcriptional regulator YdeE
MLYFAEKDKDGNTLQTITISEADYAAFDPNNPQTSPLSAMCNSIWVQLSGAP